MKLRSVQIGAFGVLSVCTALLVALWLQYHEHYEPCSLCWVQRGEMALLLAGFILYFWFRRIGVGLALLAAIAGLVTGAMQLSEVQGAAPPAVLGLCTIGVSGMPSCAVAGAHRFLGLRLVDWSLMSFAFWLLLALAALRWRRA